MRITIERERQREALRTADAARVTRRKRPYCTKKAHGPDCRDQTHSHELGSVWPPNLDRVRDKFQNLGFVNLSQREPDSLVALRSPSHLFTHRLPDAHRAVFAAAGKPGAIGAPGKRRHFVKMASEHKVLRASFRIPQANRAISTCARDPSSIGTPCQTSDPVRVTGHRGQ